MRGEVPPLTVHRDGVTWPDQPVQFAQLVARWMTGHMNKMVHVGHQLNAASNQIVLHGTDCPLVARNDPTRKDYGIAFAQRYMRMVIARYSRQCAARLALASSHEKQQLVVRN